MTTRPPSVTLVALGLAVVTCQARFDCADSASCPSDGGTPGTEHMPGEIREPLPPHRERDGSAPRADEELSGENETALTPGVVDPGNNSEPNEAASGPKDERDASALDADMDRVSDAGTDEPFARRDGGDVNMSPHREADGAADSGLPTNGWAVSDASTSDEGNDGSVPTQTDGDAPSSESGTCAPFQSADGCGANQWCAPSDEGAECRTAGTVQQFEPCDVDSECDAGMYCSELYGTCVRYCNPVATGSEPFACPEGSQCGHLGSDDDPSEYGECMESCAWPAGCRHTPDTCVIGEALGSTTDLCVPWAAENAFVDCFGYGNICSDGKSICLDLVNGTDDGLCYELCREALGPIYPDGSPNHPDCLNEARPDCYPVFGDGAGMGLCNVPDWTP